MATASHEVVRYIPSVSKALEVILWLADRRKGIDVYHLVKGTFFADKFHVAKYGRPIIGDVYRAAWFGPLPQVTYGLLRHDPIEILALGINGPLPFKIDERYRVYPEREPNIARLSASDIEALTHGVAEVDGTSFEDLFQKTHRDPAYLNAVSGFMDYRDFIPLDDPQRREKIEYLEEVADSAVL
jgi:Protein of unknown function (DUF4065)